MKLLSWGAENLFGYEQFEIDLSSLGRTILMDGINKDFASRSSNGAGKSSIIETLCWVLFGRTIREVETKHGKDAVIRDDTNGGAHAYVRLLLRDSSFEFSRYRANSAYKNEVRIQCDGKDITKRYSRDTDAAIRNLLGFNYDIFKRALVIHSWATESFRSLNDRYLKYITERLVGMPDMDGLCKTVSKSLVAVGTKISNLEFEINRLDSDIDNKQKDYDSIKVLEKDYATKRASELKTKSDELHAVIDSCNEQMKELIKQFEYTRVKMEELSKLLNRLQQDRIDAVEKLKAAMELHNKHVVVVNTVSVMLKKYKNMKDATICPECNQQVSRHHINNLISLHQTALKKAEEQLTKTESSLSKAHERERKLSFSADSTWSKIITLRSDLSLVEGKRIELQEKLESIREEKREIQSELKDKSNPFSELSEKAKKELADLKSSQEEKKVLLQKKQRTKQYYDFWAKGFGPDGMRAYFLDSVTPDLNKLANLYLQEITDGTVSVELSTVSARKDGTYKDKFSVSIDNSIGSRYFAGNSDGEISCLDLALNLAMADILESRLDGGLGILYIDQALDLVDPVRGDKVIALLNRRTDEQWCSEIGLKPKDHIFVISHRQEFKDRFESTIFAEKENGVCRIVL